MSETKQKKLPYIIIAVCTCLMACGSMGLANAYGVFYTPMGEMLGVGRGDVTIHVSMSALTAGFCAPLVAGMIRRKIKIRYITLVGAAILFAVGLGVSSARSVMVVNILGPFRGLGMALVSSVIITMIIGNWFEKYRGTLTGIALSFSGVGSAIASPIMSACITNYGFRATYIGWAAAMALMILPASFLCPLTPQEVGLQPYGANEQTKTKETKTVSNNLDLPFRFGNPVFLGLVLLILFIVTLTALNSHLPSVAQSFGYTAAIGATLLSVSMIGNVVAKFVLGIITDKLGVYQGTILMLGLTALGILLMNVSAGNVFLLYVGGFLYGSSFSLGSLGAAMLTRHLYGNEQYGKAYSYITMAVYVGSAVTVTLIGYMYDLTGSYHLTMLVWSAVGVIAIGLLLAIAGMASKQAKNK